MYPKNAASPEPIAIGAVVQISDGAVQASGVTVRIKPIGVSEGDGAGTTAYSTDGIVLYTPTQAETNYTSFILIAKKTGCIPVAITVVTTASATAGYAGLDWGVVANKTTTNALTNTTIAITQKVDIDTIKTNPVVNGGTITFPTGATLASTTNITAGTIATVTTLTNAPSDSSGTTTLLSRLSSARAGYLDNINNSNLASVPAFPSNFAALGINASGHVSRVTLADTLTTYTGNTVQTGDCYPKVDTEIATIITNLATAQTSIDDLPTNAELATALAAADDAVLAAIAALNNLSSAGAASAVTTALTTALTEGYRGTNAIGSVRDLLYEINQHLGQSEIVSTTKTLKKIDGSTTAKTFGLNSATTPTRIAEAT